MRVLHLTTTDGGGAGRAAVRVHKALRASGVDSRMLVARGSEKADAIPALTALDRNRAHRWRRGIQRRIDILPLRLFGKTKPPGWAPAWCPGGILPEIQKVAPDIIHLHWITGFISIRELSTLRSLPLFWSLHDLWPLSEGYPYLGDLPGVDVTQTGDLSRLSNSGLGDWIWKRKLKAYAGLDLRTIGLSRWILEAARESELLKVKPSYHIPNCLPLDIFREGNRMESRNEFGLPADRPLILFGAADAESDRRKGFDLLLEALSFLDTKTSATARPDLIVFGSAGETQTESLHGFRIHRIGNISDDRQLAKLYSAADVFVAPSREDNLPNTVMEALACGTPCAVFDVGGMNDLIDPGSTGFLASPFDSEMLAEGIFQLLQSDPSIRDRCRESVCQRFAPEIVADKLTAIYLDALGRKRVVARKSRRLASPAPVVTG